MRWIYRDVCLSKLVVLVDDDGLLLLHHPRPVLLLRPLHFLLPISTLLFTPSRILSLHRSLVLLVVFLLSRPTEDDLACPTLELPLLASSGLITRPCCSRGCVSCCSCC